MSSQINIDVKVNQGEVFGAVRTDSVQAGMDDLADAALKMQKLLCPVDTGRMLRSLAIRKNGVGRDIGSFGLKYPEYVENGHQTKAGTWVPPQPFIRPSLDAVRARLASG